MDGSQQDKLFPTYSLEEQLTIYRCGMDRRPPDRYLANYIADRGQDTIPMLLEKLENESDELTQVALIRIFEIMAEKGYLKGRSDVVARIRIVVERMRIGVFKQMASTSLERIGQT
jgi:hypothetical protein